jgi:hypothetical protein
MDTTDFFIERLAIGWVGPDPLFIYQVTDREGAGGFAARLDSRTLRLKWSARLPGFNVGVALLDESAAYVTCFGFVGKMDLQTGRYLWRREGLYESDSLNYFAAPELVGDTLLLRANEGKTLRLDRRSGRRLS